jgi:hypothetical protein
MLCVFFKAVFAYWGKSVSGKGAYNVRRFNVQNSLFMTEPIKQSIKLQLNLLQSNQLRMNMQALHPTEARTQPNA